MQANLFDWTPPQIMGDRDGESFDSHRDGSRLNAQAADVFRLMRDGKWRTLTQISARTFHPEASVSARLRDLRREKFGGFTVERRYVCKGLWEYRVLV